MKKKIAILGSTGSIGKTLLKIINDNRNHFEIELLSANKNYKKVITQAKRFKVSNIIIHDLNTFRKIEKIYKRKNINIYNSVKEFKRKRKLIFDYSMVGITGFYGLEPTLDLIDITKRIAIANKEAIICG